MSTQSTPFTDTHGLVVGLIGGTPQRRSTTVGVPHAPVACALVSRWALPATVSGRRTLISAHPGSFESAAASSATMGAQPVSTRTAEARIAATAAVRRPAAGEL